MPSAAEVDDAGRDAIAMLRAALDDRDSDVDVILDGAGEHGTRVIAATLLGMTADFAVRILAAAACIEEEHARDTVLSIDTRALMTQPEIRQGIDALLAGHQAARPQTGELS